MSQEQHPRTDPDAATLNRAHWDALAGVHGQDGYYDEAAVEAGALSLHEPELALAGDVAGLDLLHLQCHIGHDTLSWARMGARATGVDFSAAAVKRAGNLAARTGVAARFVQADVLDLPGDLHGAFDVVVATYGALCWIGDLAGWARSAASALRPGGRLVLVDLHPLYVMVDSVDPLVFDFPYADAGPIPDSTPGSYADPKAQVAATETVQWAHSLGEVVTAVAGAGLRVEALVELLEADTDHRGGVLRPGADGRVRWRFGGQDLPILFGLLASKPS
jgi:SAM-dependent methyltransferase